MRVCGAFGKAVETREASGWYRTFEKFWTEPLCALMLCIKDGTMVGQVSKNFRRKGCQLW